MPYLLASQLTLVETIPILIDFGCLLVVEAALPSVRAVSNSISFVLVPVQSR